MPTRFLQLFLIMICLLTLASCSLNSTYKRLVADYIEYRIEVLNRESDLAKVQQLLPKGIASLERLLAKDEYNKALHIYAAQAYYSYAFAFIEDIDKEHAVAIYHQAYSHAKTALALHGISDLDLNGSPNSLSEKTQSLGLEAVAALYWTALSWPS